MDRIIEFAGNHPLLAGGLVVVVGLIVFAEISRRLQGFREITGPQAVQLMNRDDAAVLDVSSLADFNKRHMINARHIAVSQLENSNPEIEKIKTQPILVVCKNGQASLAAAAKLRKLGCENVSVLKGGMAQWVADNYPVSRG